MIQAIKFNSNLSFRGEGEKPVSSPIEQQEETREEEIKADSFETSKEESKEEKTQEPKEETQKKSLKETAKGFIDKWIGVLKKFNKGTSTAVGVAKGVGTGLVAMGATAVVAKNIQQSKGTIGGTITGSIKDVGKGIGKIFTKGIPAIWNKSLKDCLKSTVKAPKAFYKYCASGANGLKGTKTVGAIATLVGVGTLGFHTIKGMMKGNHKNAEIDHNTNRGHIK